MSITHDYRWDDGVYYRRSLRDNKIERWNGSDWEPSEGSEKLFAPSRA